MKKYVPYFIISLSIVISVLAYINYPETYATHWGPSGFADGYSTSRKGLFMWPVLQIILFALMQFIPRVDPKGKNIEKFQNEYENFVITFVIFFTGIQLASYVYNVFAEFSFNFVIIPALALLMYFIANLIEKSKQNYMIGIRTPWTLANSEVWDKTHVKTAKWLRIGAIISLLGVFFGEWGLFITLGAILAPFIMAFVYSFLIFRE